MSVEKIAVLGAGTWGITLANLLAEKGHSVKAWDISEKLIDELKKNRVHSKLPDMILSDKLALSCDFNATVDGADYVIIVVPSNAVRETAKRLNEIVGSKDKKYVICSKGIEEGSLLIMSEVMIDVMGEGVRRNIGVLSGPSHAEEVSKKLPTTVVSTAYNSRLAEEIQSLFFCEYFRLYTQEDILGVEIAASLKNVIAIAAGICEGMGFGDNTKAALITRGLAEITRLGIAMGARSETFSGLAGMGDLIVTATSRHSRNNTFGHLIARGESTEQALSEIGMVVEGIRTANSARSLSGKHKIPMPISEQVYEIIYKGKSAKDALKDLLLREPKPEIYTR